MKAKKFPGALKATRHLSAVDAKLAKLIKEVGTVKIELKQDQSVYEALARSIVHQQIHGKAAAAILDRFQTLFGKSKKFPHPKKVLEMPDKKLREIGLSVSKLTAIKDLSKKVLDRTVPDRKMAEKMTDEAIIEAFIEVRGVGIWTAQMMLLFLLGRPNVLPIADYGVRRGYAAVYGKRKMPTPKELEKHGKPWHPYCSVASWYLWQSLEIERYRKIKFKS